MREARHGAGRAHRRITAVPRVIDALEGMAVMQPEGDVRSGDEVAYGARHQHLGCVCEGGHACVCCRSR
ncbi:MAG: hypothetical protein JWR83_3596 [Aeromicrobium sp.]|jgi:hypothetical protein|nr:hypothetical protein [Aeromicrobium sp.]